MLTQPRLWRWSLWLLLVLLVCGLTPTVRAQDGHEPPASGALEAEHAGGADHEVVGAIPTVKQGLITAITSIVVFGIVLAILGTTVWPRIVKGLDERSAKIREEIASAEAARQQAKDALEEYEQNLAQARAEAQKMLDQARVEQQKLGVQLRQQTDKEIAELRTRAMRDIESAKKSAVSDLYAEAATLATTIAGRVLQREINPDDQRRLVDESLRELRESGAGA